jgi:hypothetical protein
VSSVLVGSRHTSMTVSTVKLMEPGYTDTRASLVGHLYPRRAVRVPSRDDTCTVLRMRLLYQYLHHAVMKSNLIFLKLKI